MVCWVYGDGGDGVGRSSGRMVELAVDYQQPVTRVQCQAGRIVKAGIGQAVKIGSGTPVRPEPQPIYSGTASGWFVIQNCVQGVSSGESKPVGAEVDTTGVDQFTCGAAGVDPHQGSDALSGDQEGAAGVVSDDAVEVPVVDRVVRLDRAGIEPRFECA